VELAHLVNNFTVFERSVNGRPGLVVEIDYDAKALPFAPIVCIGVHQSDGTVCCETNTTLSAPALPRGGKASVRLNIDRLDLCHGDHFVNVGLYHPDSWDCFDCHLLTYALEVTGESSQAGVMNPPWRWDLLGPRA